MSNIVNQFNTEYEKYKQNNAADRALIEKAVDDYRESIRGIFHTKYFKDIGVDIEDITARKLIPMLFEEDDNKYDHEVYLKQNEEANALFAKISSIREIAAQEGVDIMNAE